MVSPPSSFTVVILPTLPPSKAMPLKFPLIEREEEADELPKQAEWGKKVPEAELMWAGGYGN